MKILLACICLITLTIPAYTQEPAQKTGLKELSDLLYLDKSEVENDSLQRLNLVLPIDSKKPPLLLWIGGGAWSYVNRDMEMNLARRIAEEGIAVASVGHRLSPATWQNPDLDKGIQHPKHIEDIAAALKWLVDHATQYGYDQNQLYIGGFSSGAHLAALLCMDDQYLAKHGLSPNLIKGVIPIGGAYDINNYYDVFLNGSRKELAELHVQAVFGESSEQMYQASPTSYVSKLSTPMLLISENNTYNYASIFEEKIKQTDFKELEVLHIRDMGHGELWRHLSNDEKSSYRMKIIQFIKSAVHNN